MDIGHVHVNIEHIAHGLTMTSFYTVSKVVVTAIL